MAWDNYTHSVSLAASTGIRPYRGVRMSTAGTVGYPANGGAIDGVVQPPGTTGSTRDPGYVSVVPYGVVKLEAESSTAVKVGKLVSMSSVGRATANAAGKHAIGRVVAGSSGAANRIVSVLLLPVGSSVTAA